MDYEASSKQQQQSQQSQLSNIGTNEEQLKEKTKSIGIKEGASSPNSGRPVHSPQKVSSRSLP